MADFCAGLQHPGLPAAPRVAAMRAVTTLIPHYQVRPHVPLYCASMTGQLPAFRPALLARPRCVAWHGGEGTRPTGVGSLERELSYDQSHCVRGWQQRRQCLHAAAPRLAPGGPALQETVLYALSSDDARRVLGAAGASGLDGQLADDEVLFRK